MAFEKSRKAGNTRICQHRHLPILTDRRDRKIFQSTSEEAEMLFNWGVSLFISSAKMNRELRSSVQHSWAWISARAPTDQLLYNSYRFWREAAMKHPARAEIRTWACVRPHRASSIDSHPQGKGLCWGLALGRKCSWGGPGAEELTSFFIPKRSQAEFRRRNSVQ